jgi:signal transduction histidine kinase
MILRRRSVLLRVALLVLVPLVFLLGFFSYTVITSVTSAQTLVRAKVMIDDLGQPVANLQQALSQERAQAFVYDASPSSASLATLQRRQAATDRAVRRFRAAIDSSAVQQSASPGTRRAISGLRADLSGLTGLRDKIVTGSISGQSAFATYTAMIGASYGVLQQAIQQEGNTAQVLPGMAVIGLSVSNEYLQQESALLNGDFTAHTFPASAHQAFVRLVGAHRLLYQQSYSFLDPAYRAVVNHDVSPHTQAALTAMENQLVASARVGGKPPVSPTGWNHAVGALSSQIQRAVSQVNARLAAAARDQADSKLLRLFLEGAVGLAAIALSVFLSIRIARKLTRQLHSLRDSALEMANVDLPDVLARLRDGAEIDAASQVPALLEGPDEIGQVKAAFNAAHRTAVEAAVDQARMRRSVNDVFRNLARRSQSLLERQLALLDALERRAEPDDLESLFRIDHLATRMRRHAENLIVVAGDSPMRAFRDPVPFVDILRAAAAEVEDYTRIRVVSLTPAALAGQAVSDVVHLIAEFIENATIFSPPNTEVRVTGDLVAKGYAVEVEDRGLGLTDAELAGLNVSLADPPMFDPSGTDRLGLFVAARLAKRHHIQVTLRNSAFGGVTAIVLIPPELVVPVEALSPVTMPMQAPSGRLSPGRHTLPPAGTGTAAKPEPNGQAATTGPLPALGRVVASIRIAPPEGTQSDVRETGPSSPGRRSAFETAAWDAVLGSAGLDPAGLSGAAQPATVSAGLDPAGVAAGLTEHGLPQRVRQRSLAPQLRAYPVPQQSPGEPESRTPESARNVMSAFQQGWRRGVMEADQEHERDGDAPPRGEST